jgi:predicted nucleic acid-binding protein
MISPGEPPSQTMAEQTPSTSHILDTSAVLALLEGEDGADMVADIIGSGGAVLPWIGALELHYITSREVSVEEAEARLLLLRSAGVRIRATDGEPLLRVASALKASHSVSLADALIAAVAICDGAPLVHKDPDYQALAAKVQLLPLPFKGQW